MKVPATPSRLLLKCADPALHAWDDEPKTAGQSPCTIERGSATTLDKGATGMSAGMDANVGRQPHNSPPMFRVVVNSEEQYSIWDTRRALPAGWTATGFEAAEAECLAHIDSIWTDMRPRSLRGDQADDA